MFAGARSASGIELPKNFKTHSRIFDTALRRSKFGKEIVNINFMDLSDLGSLEAQQPQIVFSYWEGIDDLAQQNLVRLVSSCPYTEYFICSLLPCYDEQNIRQELNRNSVNTWIFFKTLRVSAYKSSNMRRTVLIFKRVPCQAPDSPNVTFPSDLAVNIFLQEDSRSSRSGVNYGDLFKMGKSLHKNGFTRFECLGHGGFGYVVKCDCSGRTCVIKFSLHPQGMDQDSSDESLYREYDILIEAKKIRRIESSAAIPKLVELFGNVKNKTAFAKFRLSSEKTVAALVMEACWRDCSFLRKEFRDEYLKENQMSPNCRLFFRELYRALDFLHQELGFAHLDVKWSNILLVDVWVRSGPRANDPKIRLTDLGASMMPPKSGLSEPRRYVRAGFKFIEDKRAARPRVGSKRAMGIFEKPLDSSSLKFQFRSKEKN